MNSHHLKQSSPTQRKLSKPEFHDLIVNKLNLKPYDPLTDHMYVDAAKDGRFNQSNCAIALYSNAFSQKANFPPESAPLGYLFRDGQDILSFGVYTRYDGKTFGSILPLSKNLISIAHLSKKALSELPLSGVYVRFLKLPEYTALVSGPFGFKPAKEEPWLPDAPEEDESLCHSKVDLLRVTSADGLGFNFKPLKSAYNRGTNFLLRNELDYRLVPLTTEMLPVAAEIIEHHFKMIERSGKLVGSSHHDYQGLLRKDIITLKSVVAYIGFLKDLPVSVFICENNGPHSIAGYAGITLRDPNYYAQGLSISESGPAELKGMAGFSAVPTYAFARLFLDMRGRGYSTFFMGGSEHADIDSWKKSQMSAEMDPTYWAILSK